MVTTSSNTYWAPLKPRINIYSLSDDLYASPDLSYNAFTDQSGSDDKPIGLSFETSTTNVGQCSILIEDSNNDIDENIFLKGNRIVIEGSKDGSTWQPAFRGLARGQVQEAFGGGGRNIHITGYNYLVRLGERIIKINKESTKTGSVYNKSDSTMFTDNLIQNILTDDNNYVYTTNETGGTGKPLGSSNITASPVTTWLPKLDVEYGTLQSAIDEILDYSGGILTVDFSNDQLVLYDPEQVTSATGVFMVTNTQNLLADDALFTMYPLEPYTYEIHYDTDESGNRLILPFKSPDSAPKTEHRGEFTDDQISAPFSVPPAPGGTRWLYDSGKIWQASSITISPSGDPGLFRFVMTCQGNCSGFATNSTRLWIHNDNPGPPPTPSVPISGPMILYPRNSAGVFGGSGASYPATSTPYFVIGMRDQDAQTIGTLLTNTFYWAVIESTAAQSNTQRIGFVTEVNGTATQSIAPTQSGAWITGNTPPKRFTNIDPTEQGQAEINLDWIVTGNDRNGEARVGRVERSVTSIPDHIDGLQTIQEYLYPRLYLASKPRFIFDYPSLTMPNKIPKAGDMLCHYDSQVRVGTYTTPVQTSVITSARYEFGQDSDGVLGLRKLGLSTSGLRKGYY